ncbi:MAG: hypothetical protein J5851_01440 [Oscillospiraceae bacterium]|nr:hypothetical protein [Oscillospiraceae bacterium]
MNKDNVAAVFEIDASVQDVDTVFRMTEQSGKLPIGFRSLHEWVNGRKAMHGNMHLREIMRRFGCDTNLSFIEKTHVASISDTFWVKSARDSSKWEDVSLFRHPFSENVSYLSYRGRGDFTPEAYYFAPEMSCEGSFPRCFRRLDEKGQFGSDIYFYKRSGGYGRRVEPYCEMLSSMIAAAISPGNTVKYELDHLYERRASRCNLFTTEQYGYVSIGTACPGINTSMLSGLMQYFANLGPSYEQQFREMLVIDALCLNRDRHTGNFGLLIDNETLEPVRYAPLFDFNLSLYYNVSDDDFGDLGKHLYRKRPQIGTDYIRAGQVAMNDALREKVEPLTRFSFEFAGDEHFSPERVACLEQIVRKTAAALLSDKELTTVRAVEEGIL